MKEKPVAISNRFFVCLKTVWIEFVFYVIMMLHLSDKGVALIYEVHFVLQYCLDAIL